MPFDPESDVGRRYLSYVENRARIWAEKYIDGKTPDYRGDAVLERYHFCNVWRELDRYSRWEIAQIRGRPLDEQVDVIVIGRMTMVPQTVIDLLNGAGVADLRMWRGSGVLWYSRALQIRPRDGRDYAEEFVMHRDEYLRNRCAVLDIVATTNDAQELVTKFSKLLYSVGTFRAYELATSMTYSEHLHYDEDALFNVGPGAIGGLEMLTGDRTSSRDAFCALRDDVRAALTTHSKMRWVPSLWQGSLHTKRRKKFTLRTLEDTLCEFRKYEGFCGRYPVVTRRLYRAAT